VDSLLASVEHAASACLVAQAARLTSTLAHLW
jgi:hypothetical protein